MGSRTYGNYEYPPDNIVKFPIFDLPDQKQGSQSASPIQADIDSADERPHHEGMSSPTRDEVFALLAKGEAQTQALLETMRRENAEFREDMRGYLGSMTQSLSADLGRVREQVSELKSDYRTDFLRMEHAVESRVSSLKIWVLGGALVGVITLAGASISGLLKPDDKPAPPQYVPVTLTTPVVAAPAVQPSPPKGEPAGVKPKSAPPAGQAP
jgi:hypothetical protein